MKKYLLFNMFVSLFFLSCSDEIVSPVLQYDTSVNGKTIKVNQNQEFTLELELHFDGGYQCNYSISDTTILKIDSTTHRSTNSNPDICGGTSIETIFFKGLKRGVCKVNLVECQNWLPDVEPINTVYFNVIVK